jgi:fluoride exporter
MSPATLAVVAAGSALGALARYWLSGAVARRCGETFPLGTLVVNLSGCLLIGWLAGGGRAGGWSGPVALFATTGFLGGFTTFSSFSLQTLNLLQGGEARRALANIAATLLLCLAAVWLGRCLAPLPFIAP